MKELNISANLLPETLPNGTYGIFNHKDNEEQAELYIYFENPLNRFVSLFEEFMQNFDGAVFKNVKFIPEIHAVKIVTTKLDDFTDYGINEFLEDSKEQLKSFEGNMAYLNAIFVYETLIFDALTWFKIFYGRPILHIEM